jgi:hypothetical protein
VRPSISSKSDLPTETLNQELHLALPQGAKPALDPANPLHRALLQLKDGLAKDKTASPVPRLLP